VQIEESTFAKNPNILPPLETRYADCAKALFAKDYTKEFDDYIYTGQQGDHGLLFAKFKSAEDANIPFRPPYPKDFGNHPWPAILKALNIQEDPFLTYATPVISGNSQGIATGPRYYQQEEYVNAIQQGSRFVVSEFFGPRPFNIPRHQVPQPGRIAYQLATLEGGFPECLHDDVEVPSTRTATSKNVGGTTTAVGGSLDGQFFPRTNFKSWRPYVFSDAQLFRDGGWHRVLVRVYPPSLPRSIRRNS
jgi:hypothetical protein